MRRTLYEKIYKGSRLSSFIAWFFFVVVAIELYRGIGIHMSEEPDTIILRIFSVFLYIMYMSPLWSIPLIISDSPLTKLAKVLRKYEITLELLEEEYQRAEELATNCYVTKEFSFWFLYIPRRSTNLYIVGNKDIVWMGQTDTGKDMNHCRLSLRASDGSRFSIDLPQDYVDKVIDYYRQRFPHIVFAVPKSTKAEVL